MLSDTNEFEEVWFPAGRVDLAGLLAVPSHARGIVILVYGRGSSRFSTRNQYIAGTLVRAGLATFLLDLLTFEEQRLDEVTAELRFDIDLLAERLLATTKWLGALPLTRQLGIGYFGASTSAAAALVAASQRPSDIQAIVSRGGRPDLAGSALTRVQAPTLLIVGEKDQFVLQLNEWALKALRPEKRLEIVPGAAPLLEQPDALERVSELAGDWFGKHLSRHAATRAA
ncbi:MAG TPA: alpha/beta hydrolase [Chloroflexota bacterium]